MNLVTKMLTGWLKIKDPADLLRAIDRVLIKSFTNDDSIGKCGQFASLANAWLNCRRRLMEETELKELKVHTEDIEARLERQGYGVIEELPILELSISHRKTWRFHRVAYS
jgi:hypothetical protein